MGWVESKAEIEGFLDYLKSLLSGNNALRSLQIVRKKHLDEDKTSG